MVWVLLSGTTQGTARISVYSWDAAATNLPETYLRNGIRDSVEIVVTAEHLTVSYT